MTTTANATVPAPESAANPARGVVRAMPEPAVDPDDDIGAPPISAATRRRRIAASPSRLRPRHLGVLASFVALVLLPTAVASGYLFVIAKDQFASRVGFSVRKEEVSSAIELLGGITELSGSNSSDTDILYEFIRSQQLIQTVDAKLDLHAIYANPADPVFALGADARIEDLEDYWSRMVDVFYDSASGLIEVRVLAFDPLAARNIAQTLLEESSKMINDLSAIARTDATRYASEELERAVERLKKARTAITAFRSRTRIVDPAADIEGRMGLLNLLEEQLATALIDLDLLPPTAGEGIEDPRLVPARKRVEVIEARIASERARFGSKTTFEDDAYSTLIGEYEALSVDLEFAQTAYLSALATYDASIAEAQRQSRYLVSYVGPTLAETSEYPRRYLLLALLAGFLFMSWSILVMSYYSLRDRR